MPAATTKQELAGVCDKEFARLQAVIDMVPDALKLSADDEGVTPKDILGHRAHWIGLTLGWYRDGQAGKTPALPAPGYKWSELKAYNAALRAAQSGLGWTEARAMLDNAHVELMQQINALDQSALYGAPMQGGGNHWPAGRWFEAAGASHYRSAAKHLRARLRANSAS